MSNSTDNLAQEYPSVDLAYPFAISAYDLAQKRLDAMESRLQTLIGFAATATLGIVFPQTMLVDYVRVYQ